MDRHADVHHAPRITHRADAHRAVPDRPDLTV